MQEKLMNHTLLACFLFSSPLQTFAQSCLPKLHWTMLVSVVSVFLDSVRRTHFEARRVQGDQPSDRLPAQLDTVR